MLPGMAHPPGLRANPYRFLYEFGGGFAVNGFVADRGETHRHGEPLSYIGIGTSYSSNSRSFSYFQWDGVNGLAVDHASDNGSSEHAGVCQSLMNITPDDYDKAMTLNFSGSNHHVGFVRLIGGNRPVWRRFGVSRPRHARPLNEPLPVKRGDIIIASCYWRSGLAQSSNMELIHASSPSRNVRVFAAVAQEDGTFTANISDQIAPSQQWVTVIAIYSVEPD